ncbi:MAG: hypothetical protein JF571_09970 [Asticcacaulis sp.]|nr:hypothetical protein [Asticcacaulis sp.]MBW8881451.1 hypothetical protein [Asticcacaulis sp.]
MRKRLVSYLFPITAAVLSVAVAACNRQGEHLTATGTELSSEFASEAAPIDAPSSSTSSLPPVDLPGVNSASASR